MNSKQLPGFCANHPDIPAVAGCRHCGDFLCSECAAEGRDGICAPCSGKGKTGNPAADWERRRRPVDLLKTFWGVVSGPGDFFGWMPRGRGAWFAYLYAGLILITSAVLATLIGYSIRGGPFPWYILLNGLGLTGLLLVDSAALFLLGRLYDRRLPFPNVLRVVSYSATAYLFLAIPVFGPLLSLALILVYMICGTHRGLHLGVVKSLSLALLPLMIRFCAAWLIYGERFIQQLTG